MGAACNRVHGSSMHQGAWEQHATGCMGAAYTRVHGSSMHQGAWEPHAGGRAGPAPRCPTPPARKECTGFGIELAQVDGPGGLWRKPKTSHRLFFTDHTPHLHTTKASLKRHPKHTPLAGFQPDMAVFPVVQFRATPPTPASPPKVHFGATEGVWLLWCWTFLRFPELRVAIPKSIQHTKTPVSPTGRAAASNSPAKTLVGKLDYLLPEPMRSICAPGARARGGLHRASNDANPAGKLRQWGS
eukprot:gene11845-biopygen10943